MTYVARTCFAWHQGFPEEQTMGHYTCFILWDRQGSLHRTANFADAQRMTIALWCRYQEMSAMPSFDLPTHEYSPVPLSGFAVVCAVVRLTERA